MGLTFRNLDVRPGDPVSTWPAEAVRTALERGGLKDWRRLAAAIDADPWGPVARRVEEAIETDPPYGSGPLFEEVLARAKARRAAAERDEVAARVRNLLARSSLSRESFASRAGTSTSRLSTYLSGKVTPSAALMIRMERVAETEATTTDA